MQTTKIKTGLVLASLLALALALLGACGGGSGGGDQIGLNIPGDNIGGRGLSILEPPVGSPAVETFVEKGAAADTVEVKWLKSCLFVLPAADGPTSVYQTAGTKQWADQIFAGINAQRQANGLALLVRDPHMDAVAQAHARDMALRDFFGHINPYGLDPFMRMTAAGSPHRTSAGENAAMGQETAAEAVTGWVTSEKHRKAIMNPTYTFTGIGVYCDPTNTVMPMHLIQLFASFENDPLTWDQWVTPGG